MLEKEVQNYVSFSVIYIICTGIISKEFYVKLSFMYFHMQQ